MGNKGHGGANRGKLISSNEEVVRAPHDQGVVVEGDGKPGEAARNEDVKLNGDKSRVDELPDEDRDAADVVGGARGPATKKR